MSRIHYFQRHTRGKFIYTSHVRRILERSRIEHCLMNLLQRNGEVVRKCMFLYVWWLSQNCDSETYQCGFCGCIHFRNANFKGGSIMGKSQPFQQNLCRTGFYYEYEENSPKPLPNISALSEDRKTFVGN